MNKPSLGQAPQMLEVPTGSSAGGVTERIASAISMGMLSVGERLPPEAELASQFGIAVATLRKALAQLRDRGIVETRRGRNGGTFVVQAPFPTPDELSSSLLHTSLVALRDFFDELAAVSGMTARLAAERTDPSHHTRLAEFAFLARDARNSRERSLAYSRFHFEIAVLSHSSRLLAAQQRLQAELAPFLWTEEVSDASPHEIFAEHLSVIMAIEQQQPAKAERLAHAHVATAQNLTIGAKLRLHRAALLPPHEDTE